MDARSFLLLPFFKTKIGSYYEHCFCIGFMVSTSYTIMVHEVDIKFNFLFLDTETVFLYYK